MRRNSIFILDTNIWISYLLGKQLQHLVRKVLEEEMELITCHELIAEIDGVLKREKFRKYVSEEDVAAFVAIHR